MKDFFLDRNKISERINHSVVAYQVFLKHKVDKLNLPKHTIKKTILGLYVLIFFTVIYHVSFARKIIPGVKVGNVRVGGMSYEKAKKTLEDFEAKTPKIIPLTFEEQTYEIKGDSISLTYNWDAAITRAYEVGRTGKIWIDAKDKIAGLVKPIYLAAFYDYDEDLFHGRFAQIKGEINQEAIDAHFIIPAPGQLDAVESVVGKKISDDDLFKIIIYSFDRIDFGAKELPVEKAIPKIAKRDIEPFLDQAKKIVFNPLVINSGKKQWKLDSNQLLEFLSFTKNSEEVDMTLNQPKFEAYLEILAQEVNQLPKGNVTQTDGNKVIGFEITQNGKELDKRKFTKDFKAAYFSAMPGVELVLKDLEGPGSKERYGIFALLGEGKSKFAGSIMARIHNLTLASQRTNGVLVAPGSVYSLNAAIGEISGRTGYDTAYIIQNGRTVLGEGGGVCQVSTTLFRAVLNAGLPVVMRYPHAYRVHYYEEDSPPGIDASIFQPSLDFQFKNDTPNYLLIQTSVDSANLALNFKIYGTPDGRTVEMTEPVVTNQTPPPETSYVDDPNLQKGITRQVDWSAWGANVSFTRTVKRGGEVISNSTFSTRYQPWRAVFMVGTKE